MKRNLVLRRRILAGAVLIGLAGASTAARGGVDVKVNSDLPADVQNEVRIAADQGNFQNLVVAYNDRVAAAVPNPLGVSYSSDGGLTWTDNQLGVPADPFNPGSNLSAIFDPIVSAVRGDFFAGYVATGQAQGGSSGIFVEGSADGGMTWSGPTLVDANPPFNPATPNSFRSNDRPHMISDRALFTHVTWIKDVGLNQPFSDIYYNFSNAPAAPPSPGNSGLSFLPTSVIVNDNPGGTDMANVPYVASHPNGTVYIAWIDLNVTQPNVSSATIKLDRTTIPPGGPVPVFGLDINVATVDPLPKNLSTGTGLTDARAGSYPVIALDDNDPTAQTIYMAYAAEVTGTPDEGDIFFIKSTDAGNTWTSPLRVNDDTTMNDQMHPAIAVKPDGAIDLVWYDKRNSANDDAWDVYITRSTDGGNSFATNLRVTDVTFPTPTDQSGTKPWLGEYLGLTVDGSDAYIAFTSRGGPPGDQRGDIFFDRIPNASIPEPASSLLLVVGVVLLAWRAWLRPAV